MLEKCLVGIFRWNAIISQSRELMNVFLLILQPKANLRILFGYNDGILAEVEQVERRFSNIKLNFWTRMYLASWNCTIFVPLYSYRQQFHETIFGRLKQHCQYFTKPELQPRAVALFLRNHPLLESLSLSSNYDIGIIEELQAINFSCKLKTFEIGPESSVVLNGPISIRDFWFLFLTKWKN